MALSLQDLQNTVASLNAADLAAKISNIWSSGNLGLAARSFTGSVTLDIKDAVCVFTGSAATTFTLQLAGAWNAGASKSPILLVRHAGSNVLTLQAAGADTINGGTTLLLYAGDDALLFSSSGTEWFAFVMGKTVTYTPTWAATAGTAVAIGNGTLTGLWQRVGDVARIQIELTGGGTTAWGSAGVWKFSIPIQLPNAARWTPGTALMQDASAGTFYPSVSYINTGGANIFIPALAGTANLVTFNQPFVWAVGDQLNINYTLPLI